MSLRRCGECRPQGLPLFKQVGLDMSTKSESSNHVYLLNSFVRFNYPKTPRLFPRLTDNSVRCIIVVSDQTLLLDSCTRSLKMLSKAELPLLSQEWLNKQTTTGCFPAQTESDRTKKYVNMHYLHRQETSSFL